MTPGPPVFVLDENVFIWAATLAHVEYQHGRFVLQQPPVEEHRAARLVSTIASNGLALGLSADLHRRYSGRYDQLQRAGIPLSPVSVLAVVNRALQAHPERISYRGAPPHVPPPPGFPAEDQHLLDLCVAVNGVLVTEERAILRVLQRPASPCRAVGLDAALRLALS